MLHAEILPGRVFPVPLDMTADYPKRYSVSVYYCTTLVVLPLVGNTHLSLSTPSNHNS
jgi:hypothetical protein